MEVNDTANSTLDDPTLDDLDATYKLFLRVLDPLVYFLIWLSTNVGCAIILYLFYKTSSLREVSGYLMVTITCIDMFIAQVIILPSVYSTAAFAVPWVGTFLCTAQAAMNMFLTNLKAAVIMLCAIDRTCSITFPFTYTRFATPRLFWIEFGTICVLCASMPTFLFGALKWMAQGDPESGMCWPTADENMMIFYYVFLFINAIIPGAVVVFSYSLIMGIVCKQRHNIFQQENMVAQNAQQTQPQGPQGQGQTHGQGQRSTGMALLSHLGACKMLFLVTVLYFLSFLPIVIADHFFQQKIILYHICNYLAYFNITTNFPIYYKMNKTFKRGYATHLARLNISNFCRCCYLKMRNSATAYDTILLQSGPVPISKEDKYGLDC